MTATPRCPVRVEYRAPNGQTVELTRETARFLSLAGILEAEGRNGDLVVVDDETDRVLIRHRLVPDSEPDDSSSPSA